jgi:hypothetical protein
MEGKRKWELEIIFYGPPLPRKDNFCFNFYRSTADLAKGSLRSLLKSHQDTIKAQQIMQRREQREQRQRAAAELKKVHEEKTLKDR